MWDSTAGWMTTRSRTTIYRANAGEYWRGVASSTTPEEEVLFQGKLEVQDEYLNLADFQGRATP